MSFTSDCTFELYTPLNRDITPSPFYPLSWAQTWLYVMLPSACSCNSLLVKTQQPLTALDKPEILGVTGVYWKPFYAKWKGRQKLSGVKPAASCPGLLYSVKEHPSSQADLIQRWSGILHLASFLPPVLCDFILTRLAFRLFVKDVDGGIMIRSDSGLIFFFLFLFPRVCYRAVCHCGGDQPLPLLPSAQVYWKLQRHGEWDDVGSRARGAAHKTLNASLCTASLP